MGVGAQLGLAIAVILVMILVRTFASGPLHAMDLPRAWAPSSSCVTSTGGRRSRCRTSTISSDFTFGTLLGSGGALLRIRARRQPDHQRRSARARRCALRAGSDLPDVDVFIPSYDEDPTILAMTIAAARSMDYPPDKLKVWLLDDGGTDQKCADPDPAKARLSSTIPQVGAAESYARSSARTT